MHPLAPLLIKRMPGNEQPIPEYAKEGDSGFDLRSEEDLDIHPGTTEMIKTGWAVSTGDGYELQVRSRSGLAAKHGLSVLNSPGTIDAGYTGEICVLLHNGGNRPIRVFKGDRIAQAVLAPVVQANFIEVNEIEESDRGSGGFGHTGTE